MKNWREELKNEIRFETKKREYNSTAQIISVIKELFDDIVKSFEDLKVNDRPIVSKEYDETNRSYSIKFNDIRSSDNLKIVKFVVINENSIPSLRVEVLNEEFSNYFFEVALIKTGKIKPLVFYSEGARNANISGEQEDFSYFEMEWLIQSVFEQQIKKN